MSGYYRYYDSPDGKDFFKKEYFLARRAFPFGCYLAWMDTIGVSKPVGLIPVTVRFFQVFVRPIVIVSLWNTTTYISTRLRGKDDPVNHALGVIPVAIYLRTYIPSPINYTLAVPFMIVFYGLKQYKMWYPNMAFFQESTTYRDDAMNTVFADYLMYLSYSIKEKNWISLEEAIKRGIVGSKEEAKAKGLTNYKDGQVRGLVGVGDGSENLEMLL